MSGTLIKFTGAELAVVLERATLAAEAQAPLQGCADIGEAIARLESAGFTASAVNPADSSRAIASPISAQPCNGACASAANVARSNTTASSAPVNFINVPDMSVDHRYRALEDQHGVSLDGCHQAFDVR